MRHFLSSGDLSVETEIERAPIRFSDCVIKSFVTGFHGNCTTAS